jgi:hypothetical protein
MKKPKISELQNYLTVLFVVCMLISNIITVKQINIGSLTLTAGIFVFPLTYCLSDVFSEVYGYRWSRVTCYLAFGANLLMVGFFELAIVAPFPEWYEDQAALAVILGNTPRILAASLTAFVVGDFINDRIFKRMKARHPTDHKGFGARAILSSFAGETIDGVVFFTIAFAGQMPFWTLAGMAATETIMKVVYEIIILPVTQIVVKKVGAAETKAE